MLCVYDQRFEYVNIGDVILQKIRGKNMQNTAQQFLTYYNSLTIQTQSKQANRKLLQLEQSSQSWQIAKQLLSKPQHMQYGFQLLSKKLNRPYTKQMESKIRLSDIFQQLHQCHNKTMYFCIAKFVLHMASDRVDVSQLFKPKQVLGVLGEVPNAAAVISLYPLGKQEDDNQRKRASKIFNDYKQYLAQAFPSYPEQVLQCLQNFSSNNYKLNSQPLLKLLLQLPLQKISTTLQTILLQQKIPASLYNNIYQYLQSSYNENNIKQFYIVFLAFIRSIDILLLQPAPLTSILTKILDIIRMENNFNGEEKLDCHFISDSMEFWIQVGGKIKKMEKNVGEGVVTGSQVLDILRSAFVEMWNIVIQRCFMPQMPKFQTNKTKHQQIVIDSDDDDFESSLNLLNHNPIARLGISQRTRQTGQQFLHLIFTTLQQSPPHKTQCLSQLYNLSQSPNPLNLQLSIFVMSSIADTIRINCIQQINMIILEIAKNSNAKDPYIWQQLIKFIGKLGNQAVCHGGIFTTILVVIKESIGIEELGVLVCQSFNQILGTCSNGSEVDQQTPILQQLFTYLHSTIYFSTTNQNLFNLLTKSTILFIYYFNRNLDYFKNFLTALNQKIESLKQLEDRYDVIQNLALSHLYVRDQSSHPFVELLSQFLAAFLPVALEFIGKCPRIKLAGVFSQFGTIVGTGCGFYTDVWSQCVLQLTNLPNVQDEKHLLIQIFNKLLTASQKNEKTYKKHAANFAQKVEPYVTTNLINVNEDSFKLIVKALNFHLIVLSNYVQFIPNYNPDPVIDFILAKIIRGGMKFEYESSRTGAAILVNIIQRNYRVQQILEEVFRAYPKLVNYLWKSLQTILAQAYNKGGKQVYRAAFANVYPSLLPPNPLFDSLVHAISESRSKDYKNLLQVLK